MIPIVCIDDRKGMMFNHRRQSMDELLRKDILKEITPNKLWMNSYSAKQFQGDGYKNLIVCEDFLERAGENDYCFVEDQLLTSHAAKVNQIIVYHWNRHYPADEYFDIELEQSCWVRLLSTEFAGKSHEKITKEVFRYEK